MAEPVLPTLGANFLLKDPEAIMASILNFFAAAPKDATDTFRPVALSLRDITSTYGKNKDEITGPIKSALTAAYANYFDRVVVTVTTDAIDEIRYSVVISVTAVKDGTPYTITSAVKVENGRLIFT